MFLKLIQTIYQRFRIFKYFQDNVMPYLFLFATSSKIQSLQTKLYHYHLHWLGNIGLEVLWSGPLPQRHAAGGIGSSRSSHQVNGDDSWLQIGGRC